MLSGRPPSGRRGSVRPQPEPTLANVAGLPETSLLLRRWPKPMHDWTLLSIHIDWAAAEATLIVLDRTSTERRVVARGLRFFQLERDEPWGSSSSINEMSQRAGEAEQPLALSLQMQSGDWIRLGAASISTAQP